MKWHFIENNDLPEEDVIVLVCVDGARSRRSIMAGQIHDGQWWVKALEGPASDMWRKPDHRHVDVTIDSWQPLPELPPVKP